MKSRSLPRCIRPSRYQDRVSGRAPRSGGGARLRRLLCRWSRRRRSGPCPQRRRSAVGLDAGAAAADVEVRHFRSIEHGQRRVASGVKSKTITIGARSGAFAGAAIIAPRSRSCLGRADKTDRGKVGFPIGRGEVRGTRTKRDWVLPPEFRLSGFCSDDPPRTRKRENALIC